MWRPLALARNTASSATSSGWPMRRKPLLASASSRTCSTVLFCALANCANNCSTRSVCGLAGMDDIDVDVVAVADRGEPLAKFAIAALTAPPIRKSGPGVRAAPPMILTMLPCASFSSGQNKLRQPHRAEEFKRKAVDPGLVRQVEEFAALGGAGIVDQHVAALEALTHLGEQRCSQPASVRRSPATVSGAGAAGGRDRLGAVGEIGRAGRRQHGLRALARKGDRDGPADAAAAAGDDNDFSFELSRHGFLP